MEVLTDLLASPAGLALKAALVAAFLDFAVGAFYAAKNGTFALDAVAAFLRKHLLGRVFPIGALLLAGSAAEDPMLTTAGLAAATAYYAETIGSVLGSVTGTEDMEVPKD